MIKIHDFPFQKPKILSFILFFLTLVTLIALGSWQLSRNAWKKNLIAGIEANISQPPFLLTAQTEKDILEFKHIQIEGMLLTDQIICLQNKMRKGQVGVEILSPLLRVDGDPILVNLGWHKGYKNAEDFKKAVENKITRLVGFIRYEQPHHMMALENNPDKEDWFYINLKDIQDDFALDALSPWILYQVDGYNPSESDGFEFHTPDFKIMDNHLTYALIWFALAISAIVIFIIFHYDPIKRRQRIDNERIHKTQE